MSWAIIFLLFIVLLHGQTIANDIDSLMMFIMNGQQFQCSNTTCLPFMSLTVDDIRLCQLACLNSVQCKEASFHQSNSNCELFGNIGNQNRNMSTQTDIISMSVISETRIPPAPTIPPANPCTSGIFWDATGSTVAGTGTAGSGLNQLDFPLGIYLDSNDSLYITDAGNYRIMKYLYGASTGTVVAGITGSSGAAWNQFSQVNLLYVDSNQNIYAADLSNNRVMLWANGASNGSIVAGNGSPGVLLNQLKAPRNVWVDSSSNIFVADSYNHRIVKWAVNASSGVVVAGVTNVSGSTPDKLDTPLGLIYDEMNQDLYISNMNSDSVMKWHMGDSTGTFVAGVSGVSGSNATLLSGARGIALDQWKNLYVADTFNARVQLFCNGNKTGITIAEANPNTANFINPFDVKLDSQLNLYVSDYSQNSITKFNKL